jgi:predicted acetyltransferase
VLDVRPCADAAELRDALRPIFHYFGRPPTEEATEQFWRLLPAERMHAARDDGAVVGGAGAFPFELTVPGGRVRATGVTVVGVLPTHRRRGVLRSMMRAQLDDVRERGEPVACLWASEGTIYGRFGYGIASLGGEIELPRDHAAFAVPLERRGRVRLVDAQEAAQALPPIYARVAAETPGMFARSRDWWEVRLLSDPESRRRGRSQMERALLELDGEPAAYALYRVSLLFSYGSSTGSLDVVEALGVSPQATAELWRFLLDVDWIERVKAYLLPIDHPLFLLLAEPHRMRFTVVDGLWVRLVDVGAALSARGYAGDGAVVFDVRDDFCPWNAGRWRLENGTATRTDAEPELRLDVSVLGSAYLGGFTFAELAAGLRVEELAPGAIARADALFRTDRAPWCPEIF